MARLPELPPLVAGPLRARLSRICGEKGESFDTELQGVFFECLAPLFSQLRDFISQKSFNGMAYVHSQPLPSQSFCRLLVETQAFQQLLADLEGHKPRQVAFEEALVEHQLSEPQGHDSVEPSEAFRSVSSFQSVAQQDHTWAELWLGEACKAL